jgi:hypothetical protein
LIAFVSRYSADGENQCFERKTHSSVAFGAQKRFRHFETFEQFLNARVRSNMCTRLKCQTTTNRYGGFGRALVSRRTSGVRIVYERMFEIFYIAFVQRIHYTLWRAGRLSGTWLTNDDSSIFFFFYTFVALLFARPIDIVVASGRDRRKKKKNNQNNTN